VAVQVWIGEKPEHPQERRAIVALANGLERLDGLYLILANFSVGGRNIDLVVIKQDGIFIIELKYCDGKVFGDVNGPWFVEGSNGQRKRLNPGRKNPYNQVISYYYSLINFLNDNRPNLLSAQKAHTVDFRTCRRLVVIAPLIQEGSKIETDWKVDLRGLDELPAYLVTERSSEVDLSHDEMQRIPEMLHCTRWTEINVLLDTDLTRLEDQADPAVAEATPAAGVQQAAVAEVTPAASDEDHSDALAQASVHSAGRALGWLGQTWAGRLTAGGLAVLVIAIAAFLAGFARQPALPQADQPSSLVTIGTIGPAGGSEPEIYPTTKECILRVNQTVGRQRGSQPDAWQTVSIGGAPAALTPDVVVTLEQVTLCDGQIAVTWSLHNNTGDMTVAMPLDADNIAVRDSLGNSYAVTSASTPVLTAGPHSKQQGSAIVAQPANINAQTLVVALKKQPFGEATWLISIDGALP
jgi:hypothetical protein